MGAQLLAAWVVAPIAMLAASAASLPGELAKMLAHIYLKENSDGIVWNDQRRIHAGGDLIALVSLVRAGWRCWLLLRGRPDDLYGWAYPCQHGGAGNVKKEWFGPRTTTATEQSHDTQQPRGGGQEFLRWACLGSILCDRPRAGAA